MKLSKWLRGPVPKNDPVIRWTNFAVIAMFLLFIACSALCRAADGLPQFPAAQKKPTPEQYWMTPSMHSVERWRGDWSVMGNGTLINSILGPSNATMRVGWVTSLTVGNATLTRASVLALIETLRKVHDKTLPALRYAHKEQCRRALNDASPEVTELVNSVSAMMTKDLDAQQAKIESQITELQKLADALAEEPKK